MKRLMLLAVSVAFCPLAVMAAPPASYSTPPPDPSKVNVPRDNADSFADASSSAASDGPVVDSLAPPTCKKPRAVSPLRKADDDSDFKDKFAAYQDCIKEYANTQGKLSKMHIDAANTAIKDLNDYINTVNSDKSN